MTLIELFAPKGTLDEERRRRLGERLITELMRSDGTPPDLIQRSRDSVWLVIHEPELWTIGGRPVEPGEPPRYVVRMTVPGGHLNEALRAEAIARITAALAGLEEHPRRLYATGDARVYIVEMPDGHMGAFGQVVSNADAIQLVVDPGHAATIAARAGAGDAADSGDANTPAAVVDPICGMTVELNESAITADVDGTTYAFCAPACRDLFLERNRPATASQ
ncbi:MAG TPA: hypothetical protein VF158_06820 [Longimicrobiales bacterium]